MTKENNYGLDGLIVKHHKTLQHLITFTLEERRLFDFCIQYYDSRKGSENNARELRLPVAEFKKAYPQFKKYRPVDFFELLINAAIGIQKKPYRPHKKRAVFWFTEIDLVDEDTDDPVFKISLTKGIMPFFLGLREHYISYHRSETIPFAKPTSYTVFEYIQEEFQDGQCPQWRVDLLVLKDRLGVANKYKRFPAFDKYCLKRPLKEINDHTRLIVKYDKLKKGRKITGIRFRVAQKAADPSVIDTEDQGKVFAREMDRYKIIPVVAQKFLTLAEKQEKTGEALALIPKCKKSHKKHGEGSFAPYLAASLQRLLEAPSLPGMDPTPTGSTGYSDMSAFSNEQLKKFAENPSHPYQADAAHYLKTQDKKE